MISIKEKIGGKFIPIPDGTELNVDGNLKPYFNSVLSLPKLNIMTTAPNSNVHKHAIAFPLLTEIWLCHHIAYNLALGNGTGDYIAVVKSHNLNLYQSVPTLIKSGVEKAILVVSISAPSVKIDLDVFSATASDLGVDKLKGENPLMFEGFSPDHTRRVLAEVCKSFGFPLAKVLEYCANLFEVAGSTFSEIKMSRYSSSTQAVANLLSSLQIIRVPSSVNLDKSSLTLTRIAAAFPVTHAVNWGKRSVVPFRVTDGKNFLPLCLTNTFSYGIINALESLPLGSGILTSVSGSDCKKMYSSFWMLFSFVISKWGASKLSKDMEVKAIRTAMKKTSGIHKSISSTSDLELKLTAEELLKYLPEDMKEVKASVTVDLSNKESVLNFIELGGGGSSFELELKDFLEKLKVSESVIENLLFINTEESK